MKILTLEELKRFLNIQAICLFLAVIVLATHTALPLNREPGIYWFYAVLGVLLAGGLVFQRRVNTDTPRKLYSLGILYTIISLMMLTLFFIR